VLVYSLDYAERVTLSHNFRDFRKKILLNIKWLV
jgi:hypothetical protein